MTNKLSSVTLMTLTANTNACISWDKVRNLPLLAFKLVFQSMNHTCMYVSICTEHVNLSKQILCLPTVCTAHLNTSFLYVLTNVIHSQKLKSLYVVLCKFNLPFSSKSFTASACPFHAAEWRGVSPSLFCNIYEIWIDVFGNSIPPVSR